MVSISFKLHPSGAHLTSAGPPSLQRSTYTSSKHQSVKHGRTISTTRNPNTSTLQHVNTTLRLCLLLLLFAAQACAPALTPEAKQIRRASWSSETVTSGVQWRYHHFTDLFNA